MSSKMTPEERQDEKLRLQYERDRLVSEQVTIRERIAAELADARMAHRRKTVDRVLRRGPLLLVILLAGVTITAAIYAHHTKEPCARCLDNTHSEWDCDHSDEGCIESRRNELDQCLTLCPTGTAS